MAIYTPMQVPQPGPQAKNVQLAAGTPRRVHTERAHRTGLVVDITLAVMAGFGLLAILF